MHDRRWEILGEYSELDGARRRYVYQRGWDGRVVLVERLQTPAYCEDCGCLLNREDVADGACEPCMDYRAGACVVCGCQVIGAWSDEGERHNYAESGGLCPLCEMADEWQDLDDSEVPF